MKATELGDMPEDRAEHSGKGLIDSEGRKPHERARERARERRLQLDNVVAAIMSARREAGL